MHDEKGRIMRGCHLSSKTEFKKGIYLGYGFKVGKENFMYEKRGNRHPSWKGGKPNCLRCRENLSDYRSKYCSNCFNIIYRGEKTSNWKGGKVSLNNLIRKSFIYRQWRIKIFERDNYICVLCGIKNRKGIGKTIRLEADHFPISFTKLLIKHNIRSFEDSLNCLELWDINNGRTLCFNCHQPNKQGRYKHGG